MRVKEKFTNFLKRKPYLHCEEKKCISFTVNTNSRYETQIETLEIQLFNLEQMEFKHESIQDTLETVNHTYLTNKGIDNPRSRTAAEEDNRGERIKTRENRRNRR